MITAAPPSCHIPDPENRRAPQGFSATEMSDTLVSAGNLILTRHRATPAFIYSNQTVANRQITATQDSSIQQKINNPSCIPICIVTDHNVLRVLSWRHCHHQLWATSTSNCLIFQVTLELHELTFDSAWLPLR